MTEASFGGAHVLGPEADCKVHGSQGQCDCGEGQTCPTGGGRMPFPTGGQGQLVAK